MCFAVFLLEILIIINFSYGCTLCVLWNSIEIWISTSCLLCLLSSKISRSLIFSMHLLADLSYLFFSFTVICIWIDRWNFWFHSTSASPRKGLSGIHHVQNIQSMCKKWSNVKSGFTKSVIWLIYIYIKPEDIAISQQCGIYGNVFISTRVILLGQITPRGRILLVEYLSLVNIFNYKLIGF